MRCNAVGSAAFYKANREPAYPFSAEDLERPRPLPAVPTPAIAQGCGADQGMT